MNTSQGDPILNQPSSKSSLVPFSTPANAFAEDPAPTPTRFLAECGLFTGTPIITGYSEVNPFEASFAHPPRQANPQTPSTSTPNLAVTTVKKEFARSLKSNTVVDERFSGLHLLADESVSTPPLPVLAPNSSSWTSLSTKPHSNNAPDSTLNVQSGSVSRPDAVGRSYAPRTYGHQTSAFTTTYGSRLADTSTSTASSFPSSLSLSSAAPGDFKSAYAYTSVPAATTRPQDLNNNVVPYGYSQSTAPISQNAYGPQLTGSASYQNGGDSTSSASHRKRKASMKSSDNKWNARFSSGSTDKQGQKSRSGSQESSENRSTMSKNNKDEECSNVSNDEETPEEKRQRFLERNRMAASKCRQKKKRWVQELEHKADEITITNKNLQNLVSQLKEEVMALKSQLLAHRNCNCNVIQHYVQSSGQFGGTGTFNSSLRSGSLQRNPRIYGGGGGVPNSVRDAIRLGVGVDD